MTISTTTTKVAYTGNGIITQWAVNFPITAREDVKAIVTTPAGVDTALSYGTEYTVTPVAPPGIGATVNISPAVANGSKLTLYLSTPITQPTDYENSGFLDLEQAEKSYDRLTLICQQLAEALGRAIKTGITSAQSPDQLLAFITQTAGQVATDAAAVATAMGNLFRYPIAQFTTTPGVLDYTLTHPADPTSNNVFLVMGGLPQQPGVDFTLPNATTIRFASNPGTQTVWGFITLSMSNPDISAQVQASVAAGIAQIQAFLDTQLAPTGQLGIAAGGTGANTAAGARTNLGAAAPADITSAVTTHNADAAAHAALFAKKMGMDNFLHVRDEKASGTPGGTGTASTWHTRDLNTVKTNTIAGASLASNRITLPAGEYYIRAAVPFLNTGTTRARLFNVTDSADVILGTCGFSYGFSAIEGKFVLAAQKTLELRMYVGTTYATYGLGYPTSVGTEVYTEVQIWKL